MNYHFSSFGNPLRWLKNAFFAVTTMYGGSGGGAPANTSSQVTTSNIPDYMKPYAKAMLGGAMGQAFQTDSKGNITGTRPYQAYGVNPAAYDAVAEAQKNPVLGWNDKQKKKNPEAYADAQRQLTSAQDALQQATQNAYMPLGPDGKPTYYAEGADGQFLGGGSAAVAGFSPMQLQAMNAARQLQVPGQFAQATDYANQAAQGSLGIAGLAPGLANQALNYGSQGAGYGQQAVGYGQQAADLGMKAYLEALGVSRDAGAQAKGYGAQAAGIGLQGLGYGAQGAGYGTQAAAQAGQGYGAGAQYAQQATSPGAVQAYMNPYLQASLAPQLQLLGQQTGIQGAQQQAAATSSGAFGGSRSALQNALVQQAGNLAAQQAIGQGYNQAYNNAIQSMQYGSGLGIQGLQAGTQAQLAGIQGAQTGIAGISPALQGYQTGLQGVGQQINAGQLGLQGAQTGMQGLQTGIQGAGMGIQGSQAGMQGVQGAVGANQLGLQAYGQVGAQGTNLANIGNMQLGAQQGIIGLQSQLGGQQQQQAQNITNAAMQNYQQEQQYPYQQYSFLSNLIRGLPMQSQTQQNYQAAPNPMSQMAGLGIAGAGMYGAMNGYSDIRTKNNIKAVGRLKNGLTQYEFNYKPEFGDPSIRYRGVMAQEVEQFRPEAVGVMPNGYKYVNYAMIGTRMEAV